MPAQFKNGEKCDGCKAGASVQTIPEQFENGRNLDGKNSLQDLMLRKYLHPKNRSVSFQDHPKMLYFHHFPVFSRCCFQNVPVRTLFSKSPVLKICRQENVPFSCEREAYPSHFSPFSKCAGIV